jgi:hypothetical protein
LSLAQTTYDIPTTNRLGLAIAEVQMLSRIPGTSYASGIKEALEACSAMAPPDLTRTASLLADACERNPNFRDF